MTKIKIVRFSKGGQKMWVKNPKRIKFWGTLANFKQSSVVKLQEKNLPKT